MPLLGGCSGALSTLDPAGPASAAIANLWWVMLAGAAVIFVLVMVLLAIGLRRRPSEQDAPRREPPTAASERTWLVGGGVVFSMLVLGALLGYGLVIGERLLAKPADNVVNVQAHAAQWRWTFRQRGARGLIERTGQLDIPAGRPVDVHITSDDVIHSFWVPRLAGKLDAIPGRFNTLRIEAAAPGTYQARCAEYCGIGHTAMRFTVVAHGPSDWAEFINGGAGQ